MGLGGLASAVRVIHSDYEQIQRQSSQPGSDESLAYTLDTQDPYNHTEKRHLLRHCSQERRYLYEGYCEASGGHSVHHTRHRG